jgi:formylglycine-generating enzyme required for sulfatase activity
VGLREVLAALKDCPVTARAVILDCCRTGAPKATGALVAGGTKNFGQLDERVKVALGKAVVPDATLVAFAASPGRKAASFLSEQDANSPFTKFLAEQLGSGAGNLRDLVEAAAEKTEVATERRQVPYVSYNGATSAIKEIVFREMAVQVPQIPSVPGKSAEMAALKAQLAAAEKAREEAERKAAAMSTTPVPVTTGGFASSRGMEGSRAGEVRSFGGIEMVWCPPGEFMMGSPTSEEGRSDDETQHRVKLTKGFWLAKTETTQGQWATAMGTDVNQQKAKGNSYGEVTGEGASHPMVFVNWEDAQEYLSNMNTEHGLPSGWAWALPTEAQWEYACRAGTATMYAGDLDEMAWYSDNSGSKTNLVGTKKANAWGLHDMHGNVWEWCADGYGDYSAGAATDPTGDESGSGRVLRGGSWSSNAAYCRSAYRYGDSPDFRYYFLGFRVAAVPAGR